MINKTRDVFRLRNISPINAPSSIPHHLTQKYHVNGNSCIYPEITFGSMSDMEMWIQRIPTRGIGNSQLSSIRFACKITTTSNCETSTSTSTSTGKMSLVYVTVIVTPFASSPSTDVVLAHGCQLQEVSVNNTDMDIN